MNRLLNAWRPMLLGAVLMLVLVGVAGAVPTAQPGAWGTQRKLAVSATDFYPMADTAQYYNNGLYLRTTVPDTDEYFMAPVDFPTHQQVTVDKFELFAYDANSAGKMVADLYLARPARASRQKMASIDTGYAFADPVNIPHTWETTDIDPNVKNPANDVFVQLQITDTTYLYLYGVRIYYRVGT